MSNRDKIRAILGHSLGPICDDCLWQIAGLTRRQVAYQEVETMARAGEVRRSLGTCLLCQADKRVTRLDRDDDPPLENGGWRAWQISRNGGRFVLVARQEEDKWVGTVSAPPPPASDPGPGLIRAAYLTGHDVFELMRAAIAVIDQLTDPE